MLSIRLPKKLEKKLDEIAQATERTKSFFVVKALEEYLNDLEDYFVAVERLSKINVKYLSTKEVKKRLNL